MLPIFLCDDVEDNLLHIKNIIEKQIFIEALDMKVTGATTNPEEFLDMIKESPKPALYFLDVEIKNGMNGFCLAEKVREIDPRGFLVFITAHEEMSYLAFRYQVEAMDYISKEQTKEMPERILECLKMAQKRLITKNNDIHKVLKVNTGEKVMLLSQEDIYWIGTCVSAHKVRIYLKDSMYEYFNSLQEIKQQLSEQFCQSHKSCIVNMKYVEKFQEKERKLYLKNGQVCPVSVRSMSVVRKKIAML